MKHLEVPSESEIAESARNCSLLAELRKVFGHGNTADLIRRDMSHCLFLDMIYAAAMHEPKIIQDFVKQKLAKFAEEARCK
jgi:hypothetical protein